MTATDAAWLHMEEPCDPMTVTAALWFASPPDWPALVTRFEERVVRRYPRFRQRVVDPHPHLGRPRWEEDPTFTMAAHVHRSALPPRGDEASLRRFIGNRVGTPLDLRVPLWSLDLVDGFGAGGALVVRVHHCVADGLALARVLLDLADDARADPASARATGEARWCGSDVLRRGPAVVAALDKLVLSRRDATTPLKGPLGRDKRVAWSRGIPLAAVKARGRAWGATVNDLLVAAVAGALRRWLLGRGEAARDVRAFVPVDLRGGARPGVDLGNRFGLVYLALPVSEAGPEARVRAVQARMAAIKHTPEAAVAFGVLGALGAMPRRVEQRLLDMFGAKGTLVLSNVHGPDAPISIAGNPVEGLMFWVPQAGHLGVGVSLLSYAGFVRVGVATDARLVAHPEVLAGYVETEISDVLSGA